MISYSLLTVRQFLFVDRADYWKSQDKKFCDFCKCWLADNKPSIDFHERGKRHKENVEKKIKEISKKSQRDHKAQQKMDEDIRKMEQAAMKAYMLDVHAKADYSSQFVSLPDDFKPPGAENSSAIPTVPTAEEVKAETSKQHEPGPSQLPHPRQPGELNPPPETRPRKMPAAAAAALPKPKPATLVGVMGHGPVKHVKNYVHQKKLPKWREAKGEDGKVYYWNTITQATSWEKPAEGYVSLELLAKYTKEEEAKQEKQVQQWNIMKNPLRVPMPASEKPDPYGKWSTVQTQSEDGVVDLQLPHIDKPDLQVPILTEELPQVKFKEKQITSLDSASNSQPTSFKKRKMQRFNVRQRMDDDDD